MDALYQRILDNLNTGILVFNRELRLEYLNAAGEMMLAVSTRQTRQMPAAELFPTAPPLVASLVRARDSGHPFTERELSLLLVNGQTITVDMTVTPLSDRTHGPELLVELLRIDHHLRITREENLLAQHRATRAVVRGLAHEIKNPLGGLRGAAQLLERELPDPALKEYTAIIIGEADRLRNLVNRLLGPNTRLQKRRVNIHELLERVRAVSLAEFPPGITISRDYDPSIPDVDADPDPLIQALLNVVRNAAQALADHGEITLRTRVQRQVIIGQHRYKLVLRVDIIDNGPGIPPELSDRIFWPMVTGRAEGTGLGLSIAQALVNQHDGVIEFTSCPGHPGNTTFSFLLPLEKADE